MLRKSEVMHLDMREVERNMRRLNRRIMPAKIRRGLTLAGTRFMMDVVTEDPTAPIRRSRIPDKPPYPGTRKAGELRASGALFVDGVKSSKTTVKLGETATGIYQPDNYGGTPIIPGSHEACVVFNAPYAAEQELQWPDKTQPGAGMHFMSTKLHGNAVEYMGLVARAVRL